MRSVIISRYYPEKGLEQKTIQWIQNLIPYLRNQIVIFVEDQNQFLRLLESNDISVIQNNIYIQESPEESHGINLIKKFIDVEKEQYDIYNYSIFDIDAHPSLVIKTLMNFANSSLWCSGSGKISRLWTSLLLGISSS